MESTTVGRLLLDEALPPDMRGQQRKLDSKGITDLFREIQQQHPTQYKHYAKELMDLGRDVAYTSGGQSFGLEHLRPVPATLASRMRVRQRIKQIMDNPHWTKEEKNSKIVEMSGDEHSRLTKEILAQASLGGNPLADQVVSGSRGSPATLKRLLGGDMLYVDNHDNPIPFPVTSSYPEGLTPAEYWAAGYGARKGTLDKKMATQKAGYLAKQLNQLSHRLLITAVDSDEQPAPAGAARGLPVKVDDDDNDGALLAAPIAGYRRNTVISQRVRDDLAKQGVERILIRSPLVGGPPTGGVYARDAGIRERGGMSPLGDSIGQAAAQSISESLTQGGLSSKHSGGVKGEAKAVSGFDYLNQLLQAPKVFKGGATHANVDGKIDRITEAPAGGKYIYIGAERHYVGPDFTPSVKHGDIVEAGDTISDGIPQPAMITAHKGIGEGRKYFTDLFTKAYREAGLKVKRRNVELIARGLIDHVEMLEDDGEHLPGDIMPYSALEAGYEPREGTQHLPTKAAVGKYLEQPVLHHTIGTKIRPSMLKEFEEFGVNHLDVHEDEPAFKPIQLRAPAVAGTDPDWLVRMLGSGQKKSLLDAVYRGGTSDTVSTSFVPSRIEGVNFGRDWPANVLKPPK